MKLPLPAVFAPFSAAGLRRPALLLGAAVLAAGCASETTVKDYVPQIVTPYRIDIQQGNFVTQDMVDKLQAGQTRDQVRFVLGTPLLTDVFHANRWDYVFRSSKGWREPDKYKLTVYFENEKLARWESNVPAAPVAGAQPAEEPGLLGRLLGSKPAAPVPAAPSAAGSPPPSAAGVGGASSATIVGSQPVPPPPPPEAAPPTIASAAKPADSVADKAPEEKPGVMRRMFGWIMPGTGNTAGSPEDSRAASPDPAKPPATPPNPPRAVPSSEARAEAGAPMLAPATASATAVPEPAPVPAAPAPVAPPAPAPAATPVPAPVVSAAPPPAEPPAPAPALAPPPVIVAQAPPPAAAPTPAPAATSARAPEPVVSPNEIIRAIEQWRSAWQDKDVDRYLSAYAPDFKPGNGMTRARWEAQRRDRLSKPSFIIVRIVDPQVTIGQGDAAVAVFVQEYESNLLKESGRKTLKLGNYGGKWLIREEAMPAAR